METIKEETSINKMLQTRERQISNNKKRFTERIKKEVSLFMKETLKRTQLFTRGRKIVNIGGELLYRGFIFLCLGWSASHKILKFEEKGLYT